jgi:hypothetical protein
MLLQEALSTGRDQPLILPGPKFWNTLAKASPAMNKKVYMVATGNI